MMQKIGRNCEHFHFKKGFLKVMMMKFRKLGAKRLMICLPACDNVEMTTEHKSLLSLSLSYSQNEEDAKKYATISDFT